MLSLKLVLAAVVALVFSVYALSVLLSMVQRGFEPIAALLFLGPATVALLCGWFALRGHEEATRARIRFVLLGGLVLGAIGFVVGFFGPLVVAPDANQGPLLGIFVTGPLGFVVGCVLAFLYAVSRRGVAARENPRL